MVKISILIVLLSHLCTILCNETSNNVGSNQFLETEQLNNDNECGINDYSPVELSSTMRASPGDWPWLVAVLKSESGRNTFRLQCSGTLLSNRHILTTASCVKSPSSNTTIHPNQIKVALGRFNLPYGHDSVVINREVKKIVIYPDYAHEASADSDLAILTLETPVEFSPSARPIRLWSGLTDIQDIVNRIGYVAGWSIDMINPPHNLPEEVRVMRVPIVSQDTCHQSNRIFSYVTSNRTFCAGERNPTDCVHPRGGDSGSLVLLNNTTNRYQLRGVASATLFISDTLSCIYKDYVVYIDAAKYVPWIQQQISIT